MIATPRAEKRVVRDIPWRQGGHPLKVLPVAGMFGANGSGKSNVLEAMDDIRFYVLNSFRRTGDRLPRWPFRLDPNVEMEPSTYEIDIVLHGVRHEYGFVLNDDRILKEWAVRYPRGRAAVLFSRDHDTVDPGSVSRGETRAVEKLLRPDALFLSAAGAAGHSLLAPLHEWFSRNLLPAVVSNRPNRQAFTVEMLDRGIDRQRVLALLRAADLGIVDAKKLEADPAMKERLARAMRELLGDEGKPDDGDMDLDAALDRFTLMHQGAGGEVELRANEESLGTLVWLGLIGPVVAALSRGSVLLADELDASLHPSLVERLIELFQEPQTNPHRAQLIFNSHDPTILGDSHEHRLIGRDQVWFTEKRSDGSTRLYALADLDPRKNEAISRRYLEGRYGATPILSRNEFERVGELVSLSD